MPSGLSESESPGAASGGDVRDCDVRNSVVDTFLLLNGEAITDPNIQFCWYGAASQSEGVLCLICLLIAIYKLHMFESFGDGSRSWY